MFDRFWLKSEGSFVDDGLVVRSSRLGFKMLQFSVRYFLRTRDVSTLSSFGAIWTILVEMFRLRSALH
jgi:hypothetical protein